MAAFAALYIYRLFGVCLQPKQPKVSVFDAKNVKRY